MNRNQRQQARAEREFNQLEAKSFDEMRAEELFRKIPLNNDGTRTADYFIRDLRGLEFLQVPKKTK